MVNFLSKLPKTVDQCLKTKFYCTPYLYIMDAQRLIENKNCTLPISFIFCRTVSLNHGEIGNFQKWKFLKISSKTIEVGGRKGAGGEDPSPDHTQGFLKLYFYGARKFICKEEQMFFQKKFTVETVVSIWNYTVRLLDWL